MVFLWVNLGMPRVQAEGTSLRNRQHGRFDRLSPEKFPQLKYRDIHRPQGATKIHMSNNTIH